VKRQHSKAQAIRSLLECMNFSSKRKTRESMGPLLDGAGNVMTGHEEG